MLKSASEKTDKNHISLYLMVVKGNSFVLSTIIENELKVSHKHEKCSK